MMLTCCTAFDYVGFAIILAWLVLMLHCPILKPWFGFRKPPSKKSRSMSNRSKRRAT